MSRKADRIRAELEEIRQASRDRMLHAEKIVAWAKAHRSSALFTQFEWDNSKAAREYRIWQARRLLQIFIVTESGGPQLVSLSFDRSKGGGYRDINDVIKDRSLSEIMLNDAIAELNRAQARFGRVRELVSVWKAFDRIKGRRSSRLNNRRAA